MSGASRWLLGFTLSVTSLSGWAVGIPSGTSVINTVNVYDNTIPATPVLLGSDSAQFLVDNKIDLSIGVTNATVSPGQTDQALTFVIVNEGNSPQGYALSVANSTVADNFDMNNVRIYIENGATPGFQIAQDTLYVAASNAGDLNPNIAGADTMTVYVVSDVPPTGGGTAPVDTNTARYDLLVTTLNAGTTTVTVGNNAGAWLPNTVQNVFAEANGPFTGDANNDGKLSATAEYGVNVPALMKSAVVTDTLGNPSPPVTAARITYTLLVTAPAIGTANNVIITDVIPANTTYVTNSLTLNTLPLTDNIILDDEGDFNISAANTITVNFATLNNITGNQIITFAVTIN